MKYIKNVLDDRELTTLSEFFKDNDYWGFLGNFYDNNKNPIWNFNRDKGRTIVELIASKLEGYKLVTWHINGQTLGQHGVWHTDHKFSCTHSFIFFFQEWDYQWGGRLHIKDGNEIVIVTPEKNTGILFDASKEHYAEAPTESHLFRMSVGLKLIKVVSV